MSGTSLDGVDAAIIETDGEHVTAFGPARTLPYEPDERAILAGAIARALEPGLLPARSDFPQAEAVILRTHLRAVRDMMQDGGGADLIGFHGQTVLHRPQQRFTLQIGDPAALADALGLPVIADLRLRDLQEGGQGAPLVPIYHAALAQRLALPRPLAFLNLGGVSNLTWIDESGDLRAFDVGPGNGLIDQWVQDHGLGAFDRDGHLGRAGKIHEDIVAQMMRHPFFGRDGTKSLDRYDFSLEAVRMLSIEDGAATLAAFSAQAVASAIAHLPAPPRVWLLCGGGRHNPLLVEQLQLRAGHCVSADSLGLEGDGLEAQAMAYLAARSSLGLPITFPGTTGVPHAMTGGRYYGPTGKKPQMS